MCYFHLLGGSWFIHAFTTYAEAADAYGDHVEYHGVTLHYHYTEGMKFNGTSGYSLNNKYLK